MEARILLLEDKIDKLKIDFEAYVQSELEKTVALNSFVKGYLDFLNKYEIEHSAVLKKFDEIDTIVDLMIKLRNGDEAIQNLKDSINKLK